MTFEQLVKEFRKKYDSDCKHTSERIEALEKQLAAVRESKNDAIKRSLRAEKKLRARDTSAAEARERASTYKAHMNRYRTDLIAARRLLRNTEQGV